ncbi:hypothetical protein SAMN05216480_11841 [Pustulibacterium marinum]|uniref:Nitroreductase domain-containing protein n=1 Tax=Pustulibacterium marinum TaxID=1224947 RepID=A0A1I7INB8_9FLAO|nr:NAD(P)H-dependent oxidoreductase [Pustulibacterium marinum]SFU74417.1 hypothetical protein SAMN05216480_11841 [Pustulibacterium marinum]
MNIIEKLQWRYATKKFDKGTEIPQDKIEILKHAFNLTATSYGLQPVTMIVVKDEKLKAKLQENAFNQQQVGDASHVLVFAILEEVTSEFIHDYFKLVKSIRDTPDEILNPYKDFLVNDFGKKTIEEIHQWSTKQAYLAMGNLLTVCAVEGIDACPMEGFDAQKFDELLQLSNKKLKSVLIMPIGYRAVDDMFAGFKKVRRNVEDTVIEL